MYDYPKEPLPVPPPLFPSFHLTHSDIFTKTVSSRRRDWSREGNCSSRKKGSSSSSGTRSSYRCKLPYGEQQPQPSIAQKQQAQRQRGSGGEQQPFHMVLEKKRIAEETRRKHSELVAERDAFMKRLEDERRQRGELEKSAAMVIQRFYKATAHIPRTRNTFRYKTTEEIRTILLESAKKLGFRSLEGDGCLFGLKDLATLKLGDMALELS